MATLNQNKDFPLLYTGWYGLCGNCEPFDLISGTDNSNYKRIHDEIHGVFVVSGNKEGTVVYNGFATIPALIGIMPIKKLECGKYYKIILKQGEGSIEIPSFVYSTITSADEYKLHGDCK